MKNKLKNAYLYAYYECYLQTHIYYKIHKNKNFYSSGTLFVVICFLVIFPLLMLWYKTIGFPAKIYLYSLLIGITYGHLYFDSWLIGEKDITERINNFYQDKKIVKESRRVVLGFVFLCILFWIYVVKYDYA